jgi:phosphonoacetaldehyde hydrolase
MGAHKKDHIREISRISTVAKKWQQVRGRSCNEEDVEKMFAEFESLLINCLPKYADLIPGTLKGLKNFASGG